jgi:hypothetical protein
MRLERALGGVVEYWNANFNMAFARRIGERRLSSRIMMHVDAITTIGEQPAIAVPRAVLGVLFIVKSTPK